MTRSTINAVESKANAALAVGLDEEGNDIFAWLSDGQEDAEIDMLRTDMRNKSHRAFSNDFRD